MTGATAMQNNVLTVNSHASIADVSRMMLRNNIGGLLVIDWEGRLVGILTEFDLLRRSEIGTERHRSRWLKPPPGPGHAAAEYTAEHGRKISEVMSEQVVAVAPETPLAEVVSLMRRHHIKRVPILSGEWLIGIFSRADLVRARVDMAAECQVTVADKVQIREEIQQGIDRRSPGPMVKINIRDGIVKLWGSVEWSMRWSGSNPFPACCLSRRLGKRLRIRV